MRQRLDFAFVNISVREIGRRFPAYLCFLVFYYSDFLFLRFHMFLLSYFLKMLKST